MLTAFISTSPGLTCPGLLAPDRHDAGSRRVGSRVHGRSEDRGYVVPQASDVAVADDARWGSRPMAEHRVMSEDLLGVTHYRSRRCYDSQPNWERPNGTRSRRSAPLFSMSPNRAILSERSNFCGRLPVGAPGRVAGGHLRRAQPSQVAHGCAPTGARLRGDFLVERNSFRFSVALVPFEQANRSAGKKRNEFRSQRPGHGSWGRARTGSWLRTNWPRPRAFLPARRRPTVDHSQMVGGGGRHCGRDHPLSGKTIGVKQLMSVLFSRENNWCRFFFQRKTELTPIIANEKQN